LGPGDRQRDRAPAGRLGLRRAGPAPGVRHLRPAQRRLGAGAAEAWDGARGSDAPRRADPGRLARLGPVRGAGRRVERPRLPIVTGAPGAGKSTVLAELLGRRTGYLFFDVDWLADAGSRLSGRSIYEDAST